MSIAPTPSAALGGALAVALSGLLPEAPERQLALTSRILHRCNIFCDKHLRGLVWDDFPDLDEWLAEERAAMVALLAALQAPCAAMPLPAPAPRVAARRRSTPGNATHRRGCPHRRTAQFNARRRSKSRCCGSIQRPPPMAR